MTSRRVDILFYKVHMTSRRVLFAFGAGLAARTFILLEPLFLRFEPFVKKRRFQFATVLRTRLTSFFPPTRAQAATVARTRSRVVGAPRQGGSATRQRRCSGFGGCLRFLYLSLAFGQKLGAVWLAAQQGGAPHQTILYTMAEKRPKRKLLFWLETVVFGEDG